MTTLNLVLLIINILILIGGYPITTFQRINKLEAETKNLREIIFDKHIL